MPYRVRPRPIRVIHRQDCLIRGDPRYDIRMTRRTFVQTTLAAAAASALPGTAFAQKKLGAIGLQLYSVRGLMKEDLPGTLQKVAAIGFKEVEFAGLFERSPKDVRALLDKNGLTSPASHIDWNTVENKLPETIETAKILGQQFIIVPYVGEAERNSRTSGSVLSISSTRAGRPASRRACSSRITSTASSSCPRQISAARCPTTTCSRTPIRRS